MTLRILLPHRVFLEKTGVRQVIAKTLEGFVGLLPHRLDCVAPLQAGILTYQSGGQEEAFVAVDEGVLVKTGLDVCVSVRAATGGSLGRLREALKQEFLELHEQDRETRMILAKLENGMLRRWGELRREA